MQRKLFVIICAVVIGVLGAGFSYAGGDDQSITSKVRQTLEEKGITGSSNVTVNTQNGIVTLTGNVGGHEEADRVVKLVSTVEGVRGVQLNLFVRGSGESLMMEKDATAADQGSREISDPNVDDRGAGTITGTGTGRSQTEKEVTGRFDKDQKAAETDAVTMERHKTMQGEHKKKNVVTLSDINNQPNQFMGKTVSVSVSPDQIINPHVFTVDQNQQETGADLVVLIKDPGQQIPQDSQLTVTGTLHRVSDADFVRKYTWFDSGWISTTVADINTQPVLVAKSIRTTQGAELLKKASAANPMSQRDTDAKKDTTKDANSASDTTMETGSETETDAYSSSAEDDDENR